MVRSYAYRLILLVIPVAIAGCMALPIFPEKVNTAIFHNNVYWSETVPMWIFDSEFRQRYREYRKSPKNKDARVEETDSTTSMSVSSHFAKPSDLQSDGVKSDSETGRIAYKVKKGEAIVVSGTCEKMDYRLNDVMVSVDANSGKLCVDGEIQAEVKAGDMVMLDHSGTVAVNGASVWSDVSK